MGYLYFECKILLTALIITPHSAPNGPRVPLTHTHTHTHTVPQMIQDVKVVRLSDSEMNVSWVPLTIVEARGFLENYSITYSRGGGARRKRQTKMVVVSPDQSSVVIDGLEAGVDYGVTVAARNLNTGTTSSRKDKYLPCSYYS